MSGREHPIVLRPSKAARIAFLLVAVVLVIVLDFLVVISFIGQRLWADPRLFHDHWFSLPAYMWIGIALLAVWVVIRATTQKVVLTPEKIRVRGLLRVPRSAAWDKVASIWAVDDIARSNRAAQIVDGPADARDAVIIMGHGVRRIANVSGRLYGMKAQDALLSEARGRQIRVEEIGQVTARDLQHMIPGSLKFVDRHPSMVFLVGVAGYVAHYVLTFMIWGL